MHVDPILRLCCVRSPANNPLSPPFWCVPRVRHGTDLGAGRPRMFSCQCVAWFGRGAITPYRAFAACATAGSASGLSGVQGSRHKACDTPPSRPQGKTPLRQPFGTATADRDRTAAPLSSSSADHHRGLDPSLTITPTLYRRIMSATSPTPSLATTGRPHPRTSAMRVGERPSSDTSPPA